MPRVRSASCGQLMIKPSGPMLLLALGPAPGPVSPSLLPRSARDRLWSAMLQSHARVHEGRGQMQSLLFCFTPGRSHAPRRAIGVFLHGGGARVAPRPSRRIKAAPAHSAQEFLTWSASAPAHPGQVRVLRL